jgi:hypothetical protein
VSGGNTTNNNPVSVYYPFALVDFLAYAETDGEEAGEVLLSFLDADGCQVTVRLKRAALAALRARIQSPPDLPPAE